jgi:hypothetical protein
VVERLAVIGLVGVVVFVVGAAGDRQGFADAHAGAALPVRLGRHLPCRSEMVTV